MIKFSIITPCKNAGQYISETIESVLGQTAVVSRRVVLEYIICDGASTDDTLDIVNSYASSQVRIISEPDSGLYDALAKGLRLATGDIIAYINAGDYYHKSAFDIVSDLIGSDRTKWLTGYSIVYNEQSQVVKISLPFRYRKKFFKCGAYNKKLLPFVQQESTFWAAELNSAIDFERLSQFKYAGDYYIWSKLCEQHDLNIIEAYLGGFRIHENQLSTCQEHYQKEIFSISSRPTIAEYIMIALDKMIWFAPPRIKKRFNPKGLFRYCFDSGSWI